MNVAGKSLQDIYDAGAHRLDELEQAEKNGLAEAVDAHLDERAEIEPAALKQLEQQADELENEIRSFLSGGLASASKAINIQSQESERHIGRLVEGLTLLTKKFSESISQMKQLAESQLADLGEGRLHVYQLHAQVAKEELAHQGSSAALQYSGEASRGYEKLAEQLEEAWVDVFEQESANNDSLAECFDNNCQQVRYNFKQADNGIEEKAQARLKQLGDCSNKAQEDINTRTEHFIEQSDRYAFSTDVKLKEGFSSRLYQVMGSFDEAALHTCGQITSGHESSMTELHVQSQALSTEMNALVENMVNAADSKLKQLQENGSSMLSDYTKELDEKLQASNTFHKELDAERVRMVAEIESELTDLRTRFEEKIQTLANATLAKMSSVCQEAEAAIANVQNTCCNQSKSQASEKRQAINEAVKEFLKNVEQSREKALAGIAKAAGGGEEAGNLDQAELSAPVETGNDKQQVEIGNGESRDNVDLPAEEQAALREPQRRRKSKSDKRFQGDAKK